MSTSSNAPTSSSFLTSERNTGFSASRPRAIATVWGYHPPGSGKTPTRLQPCARILAPPLNLLQSHSTPKSLRRKERLDRRNSSSNFHSYTLIPVRYQGVCKRACSPGFLEEFFSETRPSPRGISAPKCPHWRHDAGGKVRKFLL